MLELRRRIELARNALAAMPDGPVYGDVRAGNDRATCEIHAWRDVLGMMDGGRFGVIDLWSRCPARASHRVSEPFGIRAGLW